MRSAFVLRNYKLWLFIITWISAQCTINTTAKQIYTLWFYDMIVKSGPCWNACTVLPVQRLEKDSFCVICMWVVVCVCVCVLSIHIFQPKLEGVVSLYEYNMCAYIDFKHFCMMVNGSIKLKRKHKQQHAFRILASDSIDGFHGKNHFIALS